MKQVIHNLTKSVRKRGQDDIRSARKKIARQEQSQNKQRCRCLRFLQVLWLLSAGDMHLMRSAWMFEEEQLQCIWDPTQCTAEVVWRVVGERIEMELLTEDELHFLLEPTTKADRTEWHRALVFFVEWQVAKAVVHLNITKHVVAPPDFIYDKFKEYLFSDDLPLIEPMRELSEAMLKRRKTEAAARQWLCRWRCRWGFTWRKLPTRALMLDSAISRKVSSNPVTIFGHVGVAGRRHGRQGGCRRRRPRFC